MYSNHIVHIHNGLLFAVIKKIMILMIGGLKNAKIIYEILLSGIADADTYKNIASMFAPNYSPRGRTNSPGLQV